MAREHPPLENTACEREDEGTVAAATAASGFKAARFVLLGAVLEIAAFSVLLLSELLRLPLTFALFAHLNAVFFFTKGFDRRLIEIRLRRELCFFFALIFPLAGMVGIVFYIAVLKRLESRLNLTAAAAAPPASPPPAIESAFVEDDFFSSLSSAFVRRVDVPFMRHDVWHNAEQTPPVRHYREREYWRREKELSEKIRELEALVSSREPGNGAGEKEGGSDVPEAKRDLADSLLEYVTLFKADARLRERSLARAKNLYLERGGEGDAEKPVLERLVEIAFLDRRNRECVALCEKLRRLDALNTGALLRQGECLFRLREYRKLARLAREIVDNQAVPAGVRDIAQMWCRYG
ncbi:MAG: hypothetical protein JXD23_03315 [Spirochaetales bacterium]|nr:hypothetical protein [Spirochaetales bacterium]